MADLDTGTVADVLATIKEAKAVADTAIEGFTHLLEAQDLSPEARTDLTAIRQEYTDRVSDLENVRITGQAMQVAWAKLEADGYPALPPAQVPASVLAEVQQNDAATDAAMGLLTTIEQATQLGLTAGPTTPKP